MENKEQNIINIMETDINLAMERISKDRRALSGQIFDANKYMKYSDAELMKLRKHIKNSVVEIQEILDGISLNFNGRVALKKVQDAPSKVKELSRNGLINREVLLDQMKCDIVELMKKRTVGHGEHLACAKNINEMNK